MFGGPLFEADDPVFKGVQVALNCYKIVVWFDGEGDLRTTCFRLSQVDLVGQIEFEVLNFDKIFKTHQCPLTTIERATGLIFPKVMHDSDTSGSGEEELSEESLERLVMSRRKPVPVG